MKRVSFSAAILAVFLTACGGGGGGGSSSNPPTPIVQAPTVTVSLSTQKLWQGETAVLTWSSTNSTSCAGLDSTPAGIKSISGSETVTATSAGQLKFTISCDGPGGTSKNSASLNSDAIMQTASQTITRSSDVDTLGYEKASKSFDLGQFRFNGGVWGIKAASAYTVTQSGTVNVKDGIANMINEWDIQSSSTPGIVSFTNVTFGKHPGLTQSTTTSLPVQIGTMKDLIVSGDIKTVCLTVCGFGTILDVFVMDSENSTTSDIGTEILITTEYPGDAPAGQVDIATINGIQFRVYRNAFPTAWKTIGYSPVNKFTALNLNMKDFMNDAIARGYISPSQYLVSIEIGTEVAFGKGVTTLSNLTIR